MVTVDMSFEHMMAQIQYFFRVQFYGRGTAGITATVGTVSVGITATAASVAPTVREGNS